MIEIMFLITVVVVLIVVLVAIFFLRWQYRICIGSDDSPYYSFHSSDEAMSTLHINHNGHLMSPEYCEKIYAESWDFELTESDVFREYSQELIMRLLVFVCGDQNQAIKCLKACIRQVKQELFIYRVGIRKGVVNGPIKTMALNYFVHAMLWNSKVPKHILTGIPDESILRFFNAASPLYTHMMHPNLTLITNMRGVKYYVY